VPDIAVNALLTVPVSDSKSPPFSVIVRTTLEPVILPERGAAVAHGLSGKFKVPLSTSLVAPTVPTEGGVWVIEAVAV
jgi:hypothetical protein